MLGVMRMRRGWEEEAANWAAFTRTPGHDRAHEHINLPAFLTLLPEGPEGPEGDVPVTLDLACGEGRMSRLLAARGYRMAGVDSAPGMVRLAAAHEESPGQVLNADAAALPFRAASFDLVIAYMCLHDIDAMPAAVAEAGRVLRPGGLLCAAIPHPVNSAGAFLDKADDAPFVIAGSYLDPAATAMAVDRDGIRLTFHSEHRPLEAYSRAVADAGLLIEAIREVGAPKPAPGTATRWGRIPLFLHLRAVKPLAS